MSTPRLDSIGQEITPGDFVSGPSGVELVIKLAPKKVAVSYWHDPKYSMYDANSLIVVTEQLKSTATGQAIIDRLTRSHGHLIEHEIKQAASIVRYILLGVTESDQYFAGPTHVVMLQLDNTTTDAYNVAVKNSDALRSPIRNVKACVVRHDSKRIEWTSTNLGGSYNLKYKLLSYKALVENGLESVPVDHLIDIETFNTIVPNNFQIVSKQ